MSKNGTIFLYPNTITAKDPSSFKSLSETSKLESDVMMFDREAREGAGGWIYVQAYVFDVDYDDGISSKIRVRVSDYITEEDARSDALKYSKMMGQIPRFLRESVNYVNLMKGNGLWGGNSSTKALDLQIGEISSDYESRGILEETLVHESAHAYFPDTNHTFTKWADAQKNDSKYISKYALDNPKREDFAESVVPYIALIFRRSRISNEQADGIKQSIANRIAYMENEKYKMYPLTIMDIDKNEYKLAEIGDKTWMAENLRTKKYNDNTEINNFQIGEYPDAAGIYWYNNDFLSENSKKYGALYNYKVIDNTKICPQGWHIPTLEEYNQLVLATGLLSENSNSKITVSDNLRKSGSGAWPKNDRATNISSFSALPGGWVSINGTMPNVSKIGAWWIRGTLEKPHAFFKIYDRTYRNGTDFSKQANKKDILNIRCVKD